MYQLTKKAIREALIQMLEKKPLDSIKVTDITQACDISRNTFYYHYRDIYDVLREVFEITLTEIVEADGFDWYGVFEKITDSVLLNKNTIKNISSSKYYIDIELYIYKYAQQLFIDKIRDSARDRDITEESVQILAVLYTHAIIGTYSEWVHSGMKWDLKKYLKKFGALAANNIDSSLDILNSV